jgi:hypothetical protein
MESFPGRKLSVPIGLPVEGLHKPVYVIHGDRLE